MLCLSQAHARMFQRSWHSEPKGKLSTQTPTNGASKAPTNLCGSFGLERGSSNPVSGLASLA